MGSTFSRRQTVNRILNFFPGWLFGVPPKIILSRAVLEWRQETADESDESDYSNLELSLNSESTSSEVKSPVKLHQPISRRQSYCCSRSISKDKLKELEEEIRKLREQITLLIHKESSGENTKIPPPPPLPEQTTMEKPKGRSVLSDISNVELRPVNKTPRNYKRFPRKQDVRSDLHEILKRRYAAMHSPAPKRWSLELEPEDEECLIPDRTQEVGILIL